MTRAPSADMAAPLPSAASSDEKAGLAAKARVMFRLAVHLNIEDDVRCSDLTDGEIDVLINTIARVDMHETVGIVRELAVKVEDARNASPPADYGINTTRRADALIEALEHCAECDPESAMFAAAAIAKARGQ